MRINLLLGIFIFLELVNELPEQGGLQPLQFLQVGIDKDERIAVLEHQLGACLPHVGTCPVQNHMFLSILFEIRGVEEADLLPKHRPEHLLQRGPIIHHQRGALRVGGRATPDQR